MHELWVGVTYIPITLLLSIVPLIIGLIVGTLFAICRIQKVRIIDRIIQVYVVLLRSIPIVLLMLMLYFFFTYGIDEIAGFYHLPFRSSQVSPITLAFIILSFVSVAFLSESVRTALQSVQKGQIEAARSVGMTTTTIYRRIIIPQALPVAIPILGNTFIGLIQGTALLYLIGVTDLITGVKIQANGNYRYVEAYIAAAIVYWVLCIAVEQGIRLLSTRVNYLVKG
jgi:His/Glu/Gln/Arg/opine family amino acid ABC transporter permease subunit